MSAVYCHIVTWNSSKTILNALRSISKQSVEVISVTDNASQDDTVSIIQSFGQGDKLHLTINQANIGFCAAHNQGVYRFLNGSCSYLLLLNPDLSMADGAVQAMLKVAQADSSIAMVTPKLLRAAEDLTPLDPPIIDAAGMLFEKALRHLDRGAGEPDVGQYDREEDVFGGTGAALMLSRAAVERLVVPQLARELEVERLYPALADGRQERSLLFDEAFFAYREDAELCWRAKRMGLRCRYVPQAVGYHVRVVTPERRGSLPAEINRISVRNRFLMQIVNFHIREWPAAFIPGLVIRNLLVVAGVILKERSSLSAFSDIFVLWRRAWERRVWLKKIRQDRSDTALR